MGKIKKEKKVVDENIIFVFGSNLAGRHGKGAAKYAAIHYGAIYGVGIGLQGNSYAIPTKDKKLKVLSLSEIKHYINVFIGFAKERKDLIFILTPIGCGLAGYDYSAIGPFFKNSPKNVIIPKEFKPYIRNLKCLEKN